MVKSSKPRQGGSYLRKGDGSLHRLSPQEHAERLGGNRTSFPEAVDKLLSEERFAAAAVIDRLKEVMGLEADADLAWWMGMSPQSLGNKKRRNSVPYREATFIAEWTRSSLEYILTGAGSPDVDTH